MATLLIDNYDSFTYNLFQLLSEVSGEEPLVVRNDAASWDELAALEFDDVVLSPGPGRPDREDDFGVCAEAIRRSERPLLGVCLGHQGLGMLCGAAIVPAPEPVHGRLSAVLHDDSPLFAGIPREFQAVRYHSLCIEQPLPAELRGIAWTTDGVLMAVEHRERPLWGVQFHPESICADHGRQLLANFRDLSKKASREGGWGVPPAQRRPVFRPDGSQIVAASSPGEKPSKRGGHLTPPSLRLLSKRLDQLFDPERVFTNLYGESENAFWLDGAEGGEGTRFSFIGDDGGPLGKTILHRVGAGETIFDRLAGELERLKPASEPELPFDFQCGLAGWFGYELKVECGGDAAHESPLPDAAFVLAARMIAFDHAAGNTYVLALDEPHAQQWVEQTARLLEELPLPAEKPVGDSVDVELARPRERYLKEIGECRRLLEEGETYEVCLTNAVEAAAPVDPLALYRRLRRVNPAPFSSYLRFGDAAVLSSSPERFLGIGRDRWVEARPIKGTSRRGATPAEDVRLAERLRTDEKNRAENLMIADLLRNDLGSVCGIGTVHVPSLMRVESYETVHQLVTTVRGLLRDDLRSLDCVRACFPPGSMTGAPKLRTMRIIDELEGEARGVYSGAIGWLGLGGSCDLSVAIRTIVADGSTARIGAGGAIVMQSDPGEEYEEMLLKAAAPLRALAPGAELPAGPGPATAGSGSPPRSPA